MRIEIILFLIAGAVIYNIYTEGKFLKKMLSYKKYYQMIGIAFGAFVLYYIIKKNPLQSKQILMASNEYIKYLPIDKNTSDMISPILNFTTKSDWSSDGANRDGVNYPIVEMPEYAKPNPYDNRLLKSGKDVRATKRSVSETKKKFVASRQNWKCDGCKTQLTHTFEVDHKTRLEYGGSNHVDNLVALCRNCHGEKTSMENMGSSI